MGGHGGDCPDCGAHDSVQAGLCEFCLADLDEHAGPVAAATVAGPDQIRFSDVMDELRAVVDLALGDGDAAGVASAAERAERLFGNLRAQFLRDLGLPLVGPSGATT